MSDTCRNCGADINETEAGDTGLCFDCGMDSAGDRRTCQHCGAEVDLGAYDDAGHCPVCLE